MAVEITGCIKVYENGKKPRPLELREYCEVRG